MTAPATLATLPAALKVAKPGDTIAVSGPLGDLLLKGLAFAPAINLDMTLATASAIALSGCTGLHFVGGVVNVGARWSGGFYATSCTDISLSGMAIIGTLGAGALNGITFRDCFDITLTANLVNGVRVAASIVNVAGFTARQNQFVGFGVDGMDIQGGKNVLVRGNVFAGGHLMDQHHPDAIQFYPYNGVPCVNLEISDNDIFTWGQGITDGADAPGAQGLKIDGNRIWVNYPQGLEIGAADAAGAVTNNAVHTLGNARWKASVNITAPGIAHHGNTADAYAGHPAQAD